MEIVIAAGGLPFGPDTLSHFSLGGSETAALQISNELAALGHEVTLFCPLPPPERLDHVASGSCSRLGVRFRSIADYGDYISRRPVDLLVVSRDVGLLRAPHQARKAVLWMHDLATYRHTRPAVRSICWNFDEIWTVSEFHRRQVHEVVGYPLEFLRATRNGITRCEVESRTERDTRHLLYASRPERGLQSLVRPGGVLSQLRDYRLTVASYDTSSIGIDAASREIVDWCARLPNVRLVGALTQRELRTLMSRCSAYVYPTEFEEVSCIIARECIEQQLPVVATRVGALPETLEDCALWATDSGEGFVRALQELHSDDDLYRGLQEKMRGRSDLYWDAVARQWVEWAEPEPASSYSLAWSLMKDGDLVAAAAVLDTARTSPGMSYLRQQVPETSFGPLPADADPLSAVSQPPAPKPRTLGLAGGSRRRRPEPLVMLAGTLERLADGADVLVAGRGASRLALDLAERYPSLALAAVELCASTLAASRPVLERFSRTPSAESEAGSVLLLAGIPDATELEARSFAALLCFDLVEHTREPWRAIDLLEGKVALGAPVAVVTAGGGATSDGAAMEPGAPLRVWDPDPWMLRFMLSTKDSLELQHAVADPSDERRSSVWSLASYRAGQAPAQSVDPLEKARRHRPRQTCAGAVIAMNSEESILQMLGSIEDRVQQLQVALAPSEDSTEELVRAWARRNPQVELRISSVPPIEAGSYGFDDARNASVEGLEADWILWIDTDEYLTGGALGGYLRPNALDCYQIHQHHFTTEPRGAVTETETPARLFRNNGRMRFFGKVHEQVEKGFNGLSGFACVLDGVDIGHVGYRDEDTRHRRFLRNLPLLYWDREVYPDRIIGKYIWIRDLVQEMRWLAARASEERGGTENPHYRRARELAREAIEFYQAEWKSFENEMGGGRKLLGLEHYSDARTFLGEGVPAGLELTVDVEKPIRVVGVFESHDELSSLVLELMKPLFERRRSKYWS